MLREFIIGIAFLFALSGVIAALGVIEKYESNAELEVSSIIRDANENK